MTQNSQPYIVLSRGKKNTVILGAALLWFNNIVITFATPIALLSLMEYYGAMAYYAILHGTGSLVYCLTTLLGGKLGDLFGRRRVCLIAGYVRIAALVFCAIPSTSTIFFLLYIFIYMLGGILNAFPATILSDVTTIEERPRWFGLFGTLNGTGLLLGLLGAGVVVDTLGPFSVFRIYLLFAVSSLVLLTVSYPNRKAGEVIKLDKSGIVLLSIGLAGIFAWSALGDVLFPRLSVWGILILVVGAVFLLLLLLHEKKVSSPLLDLRLFRNSHFSMSFLTHMLISPMMCICTSVLVLFGEVGLGLSATVSGTLAMPKNILLLILPSFLGAWIAKDRSRFRTTFLVCGVAIACGGLFSATWTPFTPVWVVYLGMLIYGIGTSCQSVSIQPYMQMAVPSAQMGTAVAMVQFASSFGSVAFNAFYNIFYNMKYAAAMALGGGSHLAQAVAEVMSCMSLLCMASGIAIAWLALRLIPSKKRQ